MAADWGLSIAALSDSTFFCSEQGHVTKVLSDAALLGAPLIAAPLALQTECSWSEQLERLGFATSVAKRLNVTLALRNAPNTFAAGSQDCKRVVKETDSAWLRYGPDPQELDAASDAQALAPNTVCYGADCANKQSKRSPPRCVLLQVFADTLPSTRRRARQRRTGLRPRSLPGAKLSVPNTKNSTTNSVLRTRYEPAFSQVGAARAPVWGRHFEPATPSYPELMLPR